MESAPRKPKAPAVIFYICLGLGMIALTTYLADVINFSEEVVISFVFALLGGLTFVGLMHTRHLAFRILTLFSWFVALGSFGGYLTGELDVHSSLVASIIVPAIGALIYVLFSYFPAQPRSTPPPPMPASQMRALGTPESRVDPLQNPAARDVGVEQLRR